MSEDKLSYAELLRVVEVFESSSAFSELHLKYGDVEVDLRKHGAAPDAARERAASADVAFPTAPMQALMPPSGRRPAAAAAGALPPGASIVKSPMVGIFYCAPEPGAKPFVEVGQRVAADTTVCIIEVMKLMNSVQPGVAGVVTHILVKDGEAVEFGQALIAIDADA